MGKSKLIIKFVIMEHGLDLEITSKPRCRRCGGVLVYRLQPGWLLRLIARFVKLQRFYCVSCMTARITLDK